MTKPQIILGTGNFGLYEGSAFNSAETVKPVLDILQANNITTIDTARRYPGANSGTSEQVLGENDLSTFTIDTKVWSMPGRHQPAELQKSIDESLALLKLPRVNILYLHFPDFQTPFADMLKGITEIHAQGKFKHFGISNFTIPQINEILAICNEKGYLKPSVYQGQYNAISRDAENELLPLLRQNNVRFVAYSPAAGGVFNKSSSRLVDQGPAGELWRKWYGYPSATEALQKVREACDKHGITGHAAALRWAMYHSSLDGEKGDALVIGVSKLGQLQPTIDAFNAGPLPDELVTLMEEVWDAVRKDAPRYSMFA